MNVNALIAITAMIMEQVSQSEVLSDKTKEQAAAIAKQLRALNVSAAQEIKANAQKFIDSQN